MTPPRFSAAVLTSLAVRLTPRDRRILRAIWTHRVLTSHHIQRLYFDTDAATRKRLLILTHMGVLERFRPNQPIGSGAAPYHYVLGAAGAAVLAAEDGVDYATFGYRRDRVLAIAHNQRLGHHVGVNTFFTDLAWHSRHSADAELLKWWPEHRCTAMWGESARPDGYGRWSENGLTLDFFLEYDNGTEPLDRVSAKLNGYAALALATTIVTPVLYSLHSNRRETNLRTRLRTDLAPVATATRTAEDSPAGPIWLPLESTGPRLCLAELAHHWPHLGRTTPEVTPR
ncbi:replication-relaxation family protein [Nonomuraea sp. NPDC049152]|uniref:replication-relaxation family protein n=1 Tax=Nonomuraea sp. NPDC049152 TaxID=3154350 RepID=UPI0033C00115